MELANIVTDHILGMLPEANEALVRAAVLRNVDLGESNYDFILEQAINTYLEHGKDRDKRSFMFTCSYSNDGYVQEQTELPLTSGRSRHCSV